MLYILDKHCTTCYYYSSHMVYEKKQLSFVSQVLMRSKRRRKPYHAFSATSATASTYTTRRTVPHKRNPQTCLRTPHTTGAAAANDRTATSVKRSVTGQTHATMTKPSELPLSPSACEQAMHSTLSTRLYAIFVHGIYTFKTSCTFPKWIRPNEDKGMLHLWNLNVMKVRYIYVINTVLCVSYVVHCPVLIDLMMTYQQENWERFRDTLRCI